MFINVEELANKLVEFGKDKNSKGTLEITLSLVYTIGLHNTLASKIDKSQIDQLQDALETRYDISVLTNDKSNVTINDVLETVVDVWKDFKNLAPLESQHKLGKYEYVTTSKFDLVFVDDVLIFLVMDDAENKFSSLGFSFIPISPDYTHDEITDEVNEYMELMIFEGIDDLERKSCKKQEEKVLH